jgi:hypothetical protein
MLLALTRALRGLGEHREQSETPRETFSRRFSGCPPQPRSNWATGRSPDFRRQAKRLAGLDLPPDRSGVASSSRIDAVSMPVTVAGAVPDLNRFPESPVTDCANKSAGGRCRPARSSIAYKRRTATGRPGSFRQAALDSRAPRIASPVSVNPACNSARSKSSVAMTSMLRRRTSSSSSISLAVRMSFLRACSTRSSKV